MTFREYGLTAAEQLVWNVMSVFQLDKSLGRERVFSATYNTNSSSRHYLKSC